MNRFARLFEQLDRTTATKAKVAFLVDYFREAPAADAAWAVQFLIGRRLKRLVKTSELRAWTAEASGLDDWLVEESYQHVGGLLNSKWVKHAHAG